MREYRIAVYAGDGIGIEVTTEALKALRAVEARCGFRLKTTELPWGSAWSTAHGGHVAPADFLDILRPFDAVFLGALGMPSVVPDHICLVPLIRMRQAFDQYVCLRPATLLEGATTPLAGKGPGDIDLMVVRENSEGEYTATGGHFRVNTPDEVSVQTAIHTRKGVERILRYGFDLARQRRHRLTMATKSNALNYSMVMWDRVLAAVAPDYPDVVSEKVHVDALAMHFVRTPERFDVVVASNLFGDILSDLAGALVGSLGLAASANINPERIYPSLFEPVHGSAPDIAGKGIANPMAAVRSAGLMLNFLGEGEAGAILENAVADVVREGRVLTPDLGGRASTGDVGDAVAARVAVTQPS
ncbi:MAG: tartrate dehydrogenase [Lentisphaerae bacterium]|nr:tartrate dehydrogenase [Lentisphaerota bacterium]